MEGSLENSRRKRGRRSGGIIGLAKIVSDHREAINYDLLTEAGYQLKDIGRTLEWSTLNAFLKHLPLDSAFKRELQPETSVWTTTQKTNAILADIWDMLANINANLVALGSGKPATPPDPYPRLKGSNPKEDENKRHFGSGAIPANELPAWFEKKRREKCQK